MKYFSFLRLAAVCGISAALFSGCCRPSTIADTYAVLAPSSFRGETDSWEQVVAALQERHDAVVLRFSGTPVDLENELRELNPRYVAVVDCPENIGRDYVIELNRMSRRMDADPYADFLWGIVTGYDAAAALRMVEHSAEPMSIRTATATIKELESGKWFDAFAFVDDHQVGMCGEKKPGEDSVTCREIAYRTDMAGANGRIREFVGRRFGSDVPDVLRQFLEYYESYVSGGAASREGA